MNVEKLKGTAWIAYENGRGILVDAGLSGDRDKILAKIDSLNIEIPLILLTHTHYDHTGCAETLRKKTGAKVIVSAKEAVYLRRGHTPVPKGTSFWGNALSRAAHALQSQKREHYTPVESGIIEIEQQISLEEWGFDARVIPLGGHTDGSIGLLIGDHFFSGDTVFGIGRIVYPMFANFPGQIQSVWDVIIGSEARYICPGHGRMLTMGELQRHYTKQFA